MIWLLPVRHSAVGMAIWELQFWNGNTPMVALKLVICLKVIDDFCCGSSF